MQTPFRLCAESSPFKANVHLPCYLVTDQSETRSGSGEEAEYNQDVALVAMNHQFQDQSAYWHHPNQDGSGHLVRRKPVCPEQSPSDGVEHDFHYHADRQSGDDYENTNATHSHNFTECDAHDDSKNLKGNVGTVQKDLPGHDFNNCNSYDNSLSISGSMGSSIVNDILKSMDSRKDERADQGNAEDRPWTWEAHQNEPRPRQGRRRR